MAEYPNTHQLLLKPRHTRLDVFTCRASGRICSDLSPNRLPGVCRRFGFGDNRAAAAEKPSVLLRAERAWVRVPTELAASYLDSPGSVYQGSSVSGFCVHLHSIEFKVGSKVKKEKRRKKRLTSTSSLRFWWVFMSSAHLLWKQQDKILKIYSKCLVGLELPRLIISVQIFLT